MVQEDSSHVVLIHRILLSIVCKVVAAQFQSRFLKSPSYLCMLILNDHLLIHRMRLLCLASNPVIRFDFLKEYVRICSLQITVETKLS